MLYAITAWPLAALIGGVLIGRAIRFGQQPQQQPRDHEPHRGHVVFIQHGEGR